MLCLLRILQVAKVHHGCEVRRNLLFVDLRGLHLPCLELVIRPELADFYNLYHPLSTAAFSVGIFIAFDIGTGVCTNQ